MKLLTNIHKLSTRYVTVGICMYENKYLLLRLVDNYPFCPGDWDFVISRIYEPILIDEENVLNRIKEYTKLQGEIIFKGKIYEWIDSESETRWIINPMVIKVDSVVVNLNKKFSEYKWVKYEDIVKHDRCDYLKTLLKNIDIKNIIINEK